MILFKKDVFSYNKNIFYSKDQEINEEEAEKGFYNTLKQV